LLLNQLPHDFIRHNLLWSGASQGAAQSLATLQHNFRILSLDSLGLGIWVLSGLQTSNFKEKEQKLQGTAQSLGICVLSKLQISNMWSIAGGSYKSGHSAENVVYCICQV
jgi:hypothetical protein